MAKKDTPTKDSPATKIQTTAISHIDSIPDTTPKYALTVPGVAVLLTEQKTLAQIGTIFGVSKQAVNQFINRHGDQLKALTDGDKLLSCKIKHTVNQIVDSIDETDLQKAGLSQKMIGIGIGVEKSRLLDGKSTQNISTLSKIICEVDQEDRSKTPLENDNSE